MIVSLKDLDKISTPRGVLMSPAATRRRRKCIMSSSMKNDYSSTRQRCLAVLSLAALCATGAMALIHPSCFQLANSIWRRHYATSLPIHSKSTARKRMYELSSISSRRRHGQRMLLDASKEKQDIFDENEDTNPEHSDDDQIDDKNVDNENDVDADEYLEHLISNAMKEDELSRNTDQQKSATKSSNADLDSGSSSLQETKRMMEQQQQQIDLLMKLVQNQQQPSASGKRQPNISHLSNISSPQKAEKSLNVTPLKLMFFIDGTWLYYSLHARKFHRCSISQKFGKGWQANYKVDWQALPRLVCNQIEKQRGGETSFKGSDRPLDISRVMVFTSAKKDTDPNSIRMRMFREMANSNYDVHMMETIGKGEKCVDIQLAVEMLHYATVPNAFDMAVILTGDKDFVPALVRTRQKGKEVVICSMKSGCNRVLSQSPHIRDYNVVWLEDCLDELIIPIPDNERSRLDRAGYASVFTMMRVIRDYVEAFPDEIEFVSSRDIGKYLKSVKIADSNMLEELKQSQGGLRHFLMDRAKALFDVQIPQDMGEADHSFGVKVKADSDEILIEEFKSTQFFTKEEKEFLEEYRKPTEALYRHTQHTDDKEDLNPQFEVEPLPDYSKMTVATLKEICREKNLPVSGKKDSLIERLEDCHRKYQKLTQLAAKRKRPVRKEAPRKTISRMNTPNNVYANTLPQLDITQTKKNDRDTNDPVVAAHLEALVKEYLSASGGIASSRDIGRYLSANSDSGKGQGSALAELKGSYGSLLSFLHSRSLFDVDNKIPEDQAKTKGFPVKLNKVQR